MIQVNMKKFFFDRALVTRAVDAATLKALSRFGSFVMTRARTSIRPGGKKHKTSAPGQPPRGHLGHLRDRIFFAYNPENKSVVIGPELLNGRMTNPSAPRLLEEGGTVTRRRSRLAKRPRTMRYLPRPYMKPAFEAERTKLDPLWRDSVRA
jgi:hypothetical protein